jgi:hypothetical protein
MLESVSHFHHKNDFFSADVGISRISASKTSTPPHLTGVHRVRLQVFFFPFSLFSERKEKFLMLYIVEQRRRSERKK